MKSKTHTITKDSHVFCLKCCRALYGPSIAVGRSIFIIDQYYNPILCFISDIKLCPFCKSIYLAGSGDFMYDVDEIKDQFTRSYLKNPRDIIFFREEKTISESIELSQVEQSDIAEKVKCYLAIKDMKKIVDGGMP